MIPYTPKPSILLPFVFGFLLLSCANKENNAVIQTMEESLQNSGERIKLSSQLILKSMEEKTTDPASRERGLVWYPRAQRIAKLSKDILNYIDIKIQNKSFDRNNIDSLFKKLGEYKKQLLQTDSSIDLEFSNRIVLTAKQFDSTIKDGKEFFQTIFRGSTNDETMLLLNGIKANILSAENNILQFCQSRTTYHIIYDEFYSLIIGQNKSQLKSGEMLEITAGIGEFSYPTEASAIINGKQIELGENPYYLARIKAPTQPGKYRVPVRISFLNQNTGHKEIVERQIEYTVAEPCNDQQP